MLVRSTRRRRCRYNKKKHERAAGLAIRRARGRVLGHARVPRSWTVPGTGLGPCGCVLTNAYVVMAHVAMALYSDGPA